MTRTRPLLVCAVLLAACPSGDEAPTPEPTPEPTPVADDDDGRGAPPWLVAELRSNDPDALLRRINDVSGYMRLAVFDVQPPLKDPAAITFLGEINPTIKMLDVDGDGVLDVTADVDVPSLEGGDPLATIQIGSSEANDGRTAMLGLRAVDFLGNVVATADSDERVPFSAPKTEPFFLSLGPIDLAGGAPPPCEDGQDNDGDGWADGEDPDCDGGAALEVGFGTDACNDGVDNDGDGGTDRDDGDCLNARSLSELPGCEDGVDNDGDGWIDAADPDCPGGPEAGRSGSGCNNGVDDDADGRADQLDVDCASAEASEE